jgi:uncharacterized protein (TIGR02271 family)
MADETRVLGEGGLRGTVLGPSETDPDSVALELDDGREISVPASDLKWQADGNWHFEPGSETVVPVIAEDLDVSVRKKPVSKVRVEKQVTGHDETVSMPLHRERAEVKRVMINRPVDGPLPVRREGDTIIMPVVEEVAVVEKRLMLKEEIHVTRRRTTERHEETVTLQREHADVHREDNQGRPLSTPVEWKESSTEPELFDHRDEGLLGPRPPARVRRNKIIEPD